MQGSLYILYYYIEVHEPSHQMMEVLPGETPRQPANQPFQWSLSWAIVTCEAPPDGEAHNMDARLIVHQYFTLPSSAKVKNLSTSFTCYLLPSGINNVIGYNYVMCSASFPFRIEQVQGCHLVSTELLWLYPLKCNLGNPAAFGAVQTMC